MLMDVSQQQPSSAAVKVACARCECCGLTEECTEEYIKRVRDIYSGCWVCGLCAEAVNDEMVRSEERIGNEEALNQHMSFCHKFKNLKTTMKTPSDDELISAVKQLLLRSLESPRKKVGAYRRSRS